MTIAIFLDWDDTLFATEHLKRLRQSDRTLDVLPISLRLELLRLEDAAIALIKECCRLSDFVCIVTNSPPGWLQSSCCRFHPNLAKVLKQNGVGIISARGVYQSTLPNQPLLWKKKAFSWLCCYARKQLLLKIGSLLIVGDSNCELQAGQFTAKLESIKYFKHAKIVGISPTEIAKRLVALKNQMTEIAELQDDKEIQLL